MGASGQIVLGRLAESSHQVAGAVVEEVLLRLGHDVAVMDGLHTDMYAALAAGDIHLFATGWLPHGHGILWAGVKDRVDEVATLFTGARYFWAVPCYVPQAQVAELEDLSDPDVVEDMTTLTIVGSTPASGLNRWSAQLIEAYGLAEAGWQLQPGSVDEIIATVRRRLGAGDWFVTPTWVPHHLSDVFDLRRLDDPRRVFPPPDRASLLGHRESVALLPERTRRVLGRVRLTVDDVNEMDSLVNLDGLDPLVAAREWMDERDSLVRCWLA
ncbi:glycine betaine ABC transporter substrate-binding protein [Granulicoccus sp. GXG6511]|uniref:glycine betaine ABC transporter substrate-binding protein n=1 Tax=Granulicoccus sp. GXG6511 TaxID=3381351 RepID=UPI003D7CC9F4